MLRSAAATSVHGGGKAKAGSTISLSFTVTNSSPHAITNVRLAPTFPTGGKVGAKFKGAGAALAGLTCDLYGCMLASLGKDSSITVVLDFEILWASEASEVEIGALVGYEGSLDYDVVLDTIDVALGTPAAPGLASDSGASSSDGITNVAAASFSGTYAPNIGLDVYDGLIRLGSTRSDASGHGRSPPRL